MNTIRSRGDIIFNVVMRCMIQRRHLPGGILRRLHHQ